MNEEVLLFRFCFKSTLALKAFKPLHDTSWSNYRQVISAL